MESIVVISGGAGFLGSHLAKSLAARGSRVVIFDSFDAGYDPAEQWNNVADLVADGQVELIVGDVRDEAALGRLFTGRNATHVVHLAAKSELAGAPSVEVCDVNVTGSMQLLAAARSHGVPKVILASGAAVYGTGAGGFAEDAALAPVTPYGISKVAMEQLGRVYAVEHGLTVTALRFFSIYGTGQPPSMACARFMAAAASGESVTVYGDLASRRNFTHVSDAVSAVESCLELDRADFRVFNIAHRSSVKVAALLERVEALHDCSLERVAKPARPGELPSTFAEVDRAREELGFEAKVSLAEGLEEMAKRPHE